MKIIPQLSKLIYIILIAAWSFFYTVDALSITKNKDAPEMWDLSSTEKEVLLKKISASRISSRLTSSGPSLDLENASETPLKAYNYLTSSESPDINLAVINVLISGFPQIADELFKMAVNSRLADVTTYKTYILARSKHNYLVNEEDDNYYAGDAVNYTTLDNILLAFSRIKNEAKTSDYITLIRALAKGLKFAFNGAEVRVLFLIREHIIEASRRDFVTPEALRSFLEALLNTTCYYPEAASRTHDFTITLLNHAIEKGILTSNRDILEEYLSKTLTRVENLEDSESYFNASTESLEGDDDDIKLHYKALKDTYYVFTLAKKQGVTLINEKSYVNAIKAAIIYKKDYELGFAIFKEAVEKNIASIDILHTFISLVAMKHPPMAVEAFFKVVIEKKIIPPSTFETYSYSLVRIYEVLLSSKDIENRPDVMYEIVKTAKNAKNKFSKDFLKLFYLPFLVAAIKSGNIDDAIRAAKEIEDDNYFVGAYDHSKIISVSLATNFYSQFIKLASDNGYTKEALSVYQYALAKHPYDDKNNHPPFSGMAYNLGMHVLDACLGVLIKLNQIEKAIAELLKRCPKYEDTITLKEFDARDLGRITSKNRGDVVLHGGDCENIIYTVLEHIIRQNKSNEERRITLTYMDSDTPGSENDKIYKKVQRFASEHPSVTVEKPLQKKDDQNRYIKNTFEVNITIRPDKVASSTTSAISTSSSSSASVNDSSHRNSLATSGSSSSLSSGSLGSSMPRSSESSKNNMLVSSSAISSNSANSLSSSNLSSGSLSSSLPQSSESFKSNVLVSSSVTSSNSASVTMLAPVGLSISSRLPQAESERSGSKKRHLQDEDRETQGANKSLKTSSPSSSHLLMSSLSTEKSTNATSELSSIEEDTNTQSSTTPSYSLSNSAHNNTAVLASTTMLAPVSLSSSSRFATNTAIVSREASTNSASTTNNTQSTQLGLSNNGQNQGDGNTGVSSSSSASNTKLNNLDANVSVIDNEKETQHSEPSTTINNELFKLSNNMDLKTPTITDIQDLIMAEQSVRDILYGKRSCTLEELETLTTITLNKSGNVSTSMRKDLMLILAMLNERMANEKVRVKIKPSMDFVQPIIPRKKAGIFDGVTYKWYGDIDVSKQALPY